MEDEKKDERKAKNGGPGIRREEMDRVIGRLRDSKAMGGDGIPNEVWKYGGGAVRKWIRDLCKEIWEGEAGQRIGRGGDSSGDEGARGRGRE